MGGNDLRTHDVEILTLSILIHMDDGGNPLTRKKGSPYRSGGGCLFNLIYRIVRGDSEFEIAVPLYCVIVVNRNHFIALTMAA